MKSVEQIERAYKSLEVTFKNVAANAPAAVLARCQMSALAWVLDLSNNQNQFLSESSELLDDMSKLQ